MRTYSPVILFLSVVLLSGCAKVYYSPDAYQIAHSHRIVAIAPPKVYITPNKMVKAEDLIEQELVESNAFQQEMHSWMLMRKMQGNMYIEIQDVATTNAILLKAGYFGDVRSDRMRVRDNTTANSDKNEF